LSVNVVAASSGETRVVRVRSDGSLDPGWGSGGHANLPQAANALFPRASFRLADGGFLVAGNVAVRFRPDGTFDTGYGSAGVSDAFDPAAAMFGPAPAVALLPDGALVAQFTERSGGVTSLTFTRIGADGRRDASFGDNGFHRLPIDASRRVPYAWGLQRDGRIQVGTYTVGTQDVLSPELHRYPFDFSPSEAAAGRLVPRDVIATWLSPGALVDAQGRLLIATGCYSGPCENGRLMLSRFDPAGRPDPSFGQGGRALTTTGASLGSESFDIRIVNLASDATITVVLAHSAGVNRSVFDYSLRVVRFTDAGLLDARFPNGQALGSATDSVAMDDRGRLLVGAYERGCTLKRFLGDQPRSGATLVEYQYRDRYFITAEGPESSILDTDPATEKLRRTGQVIGGWLPAAQLPTSLPLCRFTGDPATGPVGHFYSLQGAECDLVRSDDMRLPPGVRTWRYEGIAFNESPASDAGSCPLNLQPVHRLYNDAARRGGDPNHRFTTDTAVIAEMQAKGWVLEGVAFCAPPATR
jgi:hypothetical protein